MDSSLSSEEEKTQIVKHPSCTEFISVPSFPLKAYEIVSDPNYKEIVRWTKEGDAFIITDKNAFSDQVLPVYFKHKNLSTFIRQLNIYGFKKTKYKNEEHCFAHKDFKRDNKRLLLNMRRRAKNKNSDKKSQESDNSYFSKSEVMRMFERMEKRIEEQDQKIERLFKTNSEFKNSVLALYTQLEESKEREKRLEKVLYDMAPYKQQPSNTILDEQMNDHYQENYDNMFRLNKKEMYALFSNFMNSFISQLNKNDSNIYVDGKNKYNYFQRSSPSPNARKVFPLDQEVANPMIENGPLISISDK